ncbi:hypothetical protein ACRRVD_01410 [Candidatus Cardinium hertigii]|uniref:hypothetical protein n=1 Tax=Candidatus Cardinium hertigii TaxID=247481 RepID=UPI003D7D1B47
MHRNINKVKLIRKGNIGRSLFLSTMGTFLFAFNCNKDAHDFRAKAIQNRLDPNFRLFNEPSRDHLRCASSIKEAHDSGVIYNGAIQRVVDSNPSELSQVVVALTDDLKEEVGTCSIAIQTDDLKEEVSTCSIAIQTDDLQEEVDCDSHKDEFSDGEWDPKGDIDSYLYSEQDEYFLC